MTIIGNLTKKPDLRSTPDGVSVCSFTVAVNKPKKNGKEQPADFFNVTAWRERGELCAKYLDKGRKVCVVGPVSCHIFDRSNGEKGCSLDVTAEKVEFLSSSNENQGNTTPDGYTPVDTETPF